MSQTVLITGASSGIGRATAHTFTAAGWNVVATMRAPERETELGHLPNVLVTTLDVQQPASIAAAIAAGIARFGHLDAVINNAGYGQFGVFEGTAPAAIAQQFDINVFGVMRVIEAILLHFRQRRAGLILNVSSGAGRFTLPLISLYAASKFALEGFSEALSHELSALRIGVKIIEPGGTDTNFNYTSQQQATASHTPADYQSVVAATGQLLAALRTQSITAQQVADVIFAAATDGQPTLRYAIGNPDFLRRLAARKQLPDQEYIDGIRASLNQFLPQPAQ